MSAFLFIQTYPYEENYGGDSEYIQRLASYFKSNDHDVNFLISDIQRGRTVPFYKSPYPIDCFSSYQVRNAARFGRTVLSLDPIYPLRAIAHRALATPKPVIGDMGKPIWSQAEFRWIERRIELGATEVIFLCFDAVLLAPYLADTGRCIVALPSILPGRSLKLDEAEEQLAPIATPPSYFLTAASAADIIAVNADEDARLLSELLPQKRIVVTKIGSSFYESAPDEGSCDILFVGNDTEPNVDAVRWFLDDIWMKVLQDVPSARLRLVGRVTNAFASHAPGVDLVGRVEDLASEYRRAQVVIAPLRQGSAGMKIKVAEAVSHGCPVVTTSVGVDPAVPDQLDDAGFVANTPEQFADCIGRLLLDPELRAGKAQGARAVHERHFSYEASYGPLQQEISDFFSKC